MNEQYYNSLSLADLLKLTQANNTMLSNASYGKTGGGLSSASSDKQLTDLQNINNYIYNILIPLKKQQANNKDIPTAPTMPLQANPFNIATLDTTQTNSMRQTVSKNLLGINQYKIPLIENKTVQGGI
jgi:hypothetical protein